MAEFEIDADDLTEALDAYSLELERQMTRAMRNGGAMLAAEARARAPRGPTSHLAGSIQGIEPTGSFLAGTLSGGAVAIAAYAEYVEAGTRPHEIRPRYRAALRWPALGGFTFARRVRHPGTRAQPYMEPALDAVADAIVAELQAAADLAAARVGL